MTGMFDPWSSTLEEAQAAQQMFEDQSSPEGPIFQWVAAQDLNKQAKKAERTGFDVLAAVAQCAMHGLVMPDWLVRDYLRRYRAVQQLHVESWDDERAFEKPYPKGAQIAAMRRRRLNRYKVALAVNDFVRSNPDAPLDLEWPRIGDLVAKSDKEAQKLFAEAVKMGISASVKDIRSKHLPPNIGKVRGRQKK